MTITTYNPMINKNFKLFIDKIPSVTFFCNEIELPSVSGEVLEINTPAGAPLKFASYNNSSYGEFSINFIVDENMENFIELKKWFDGIYEDLNARNALAGIRAELLIPHSIFESDGSLMFMRNDSTVSKVFMLRDMFPISISGISLSLATLKDQTPITATATFAIRKYDIVANE